MLWHSLLMSDSVTSPAQTKTALLSMTPEELVELAAQINEKPYRAKQLLEWIYKKRAESFEEMTSLSKTMQAFLEQNYSLRSLTFARVEGSKDTTRKYLFKLHDGRFVETVLIPASVSFAGERSNRRTLCVSSQVGCAYDCKFCASGLAGFTRNLTAAEIVEQIVQVEKHSGERVDNLVFMGMGEPLANYNQVTRAITVLNAHWGVNIGARHITVSTSGLAPQIKKLAEFPLQVRLALSLHGASDDVRNQIMPVNRKHPLDELFDSLTFWTQHKKQKITFEYILIKGVNDSDEQARLLAKRARGLEAKVNLIPYNTVDGLPWERPDIPTQDRFRDTVASGGVVVTLRREKGHDIAAACGQLRLKEETDLGIIPAMIPEKRRSISASLND